MMKHSLLRLCIVFASFNAIADEVYPSLFEAEVGKPFDHPKATESKDRDRPTTQFRVPNYGQTSTLFPEYEVTYLNSSNVVSIVTAESASRDIQDCADKKSEIFVLLKSAFPNHKATPQDRSNLGGSNEYSTLNENGYYVLQCRRSYGPFWTLHLQFRDKIQDKELKDAWNTYFKE